jgi:G3E family GTPase
MSVACALQSVEQIAFADIILLNKVDLVDEAHKKRVISRIKVGRCLATAAGLSLLT